MEGSQFFKRLRSKVARTKQEGPQPINAKATPYVVFTCIVSALGGLLFGYDGGVTGGISTMHEFQQKFFPGQYERNYTRETYYCKYNDAILQLFATIMYFSGAFASIPGALLSKRYGRTMTMTLAGMSFLVGTAVLVAAPRPAMLLLGRCFWGIGVGMADQAATIYSSEMAPPHLRGSLTMLFQLCVVVGILVAQSVNVGTSHIHTHGWKISIGIAAIPGILLMVGGLLLPESANSLVERGYLQQGRAVLEAIRGTADVDDEYGTIVIAQRRERAAGGNELKAILRREHRPHLIMSIALPFFQMWTGINAIVLFAPFLFQGLGPRFVSETGQLLASVIVGAVQVIGTIFGITIVDRFGRRQILIVSSLVTFMAELALAIVFASTVTEQTVVLSPKPAIVSIVLISVFVAAFGFGWGPLAWIISSELQPLETRSIGQGITVFVQLISGAAVGQSFLKVLCSLGYGVYILFACMQLLAAVFTYLFLPETSNGIPIERVSEVFRVHWFWKRFYSEDPEAATIEQELRQILKEQKAFSGKLSGKRKPSQDTASNSMSGWESQVSAAGSRKVLDLAQNTRQLDSHSELHAPPSTSTLSRKSLKDQ